MAEVRLNSGRRTFLPNVEVRNEFYRYFLEVCKLAGSNADVMNMDIEGAEVLALKVATNTLKGLPKIIVEIHGNNPEAVKHLLHTNGFNTEIICEAMNYVIGTKS